MSPEVVADPEYQKDRALWFSDSEVKVEGEMHVETAATGICCLGPKQYCVENVLENTVNIKNRGVQKRFLHQLNFDCFVAIHMDRQKGLKSGIDLPKIQGAGIRRRPDGVGMASYQDARRALNGAFLKRELIGNASGDTRVLKGV